MTTIEQLIPHRLPFRFVDEILSVGEAGGEFALDLATHDDRLTDGTLAPLMLIEAMAQSAAAFHGANAAARGAGMETGMLVQIDTAKLYRAARGGERVRLSVRPSRQLGALVRIIASARVDESPLAEAELTVARGV